MPTAPPVGALLSLARWLGNIATKMLFAQTFHRSHEIWAKRYRLGAHWEKCGDYIEYSIYLAQFTDPKPRASKIAIRSTTEENIARLSVTFEAESGVARFQERITMVDVNRKAIVWTLTNIPYQDYLGFNQSGPKFAWDSYQLRDIHIKLQCGKDITPFDSMTSHLTHTWILNSQWEFKWNKFWNLDAVQWAKYRLMQYWRFRFGMPAIIVYSPFPSSSRSVSWQQVKMLITRPVARLMATEFACSMQFWVLLWSGLFVLNDESELQWRWRAHST